MSNDISNFVKTWVSTKLKFMVKWNNQKCFKSASGSVALKKNTWGIPWNIQTGTQNLYLIKLNWQYYRRLNAILYIQLLKYYVIVIIPCGHYTIFPSRAGQWRQWVNMNRGSASNYWFDDNKRFEPVTNTVTKAIQNTVVHETYL